jgi:hypothetical protein
MERIWEAIDATLEVPSGAAYGRGMPFFKLAYVEVLREGMRAHRATFQTYPPKRVMSLRAPGSGAAPPTA